MTRGVRWLGGAVFGLCLAALIPFLVEKGAEPKGHMVLWLLYGALLFSAITWGVATTALRARGRVMPLEIRFSLDSSEELALALRPERPQSALLCIAIQNPNSFNIRGAAINAIIPQSLHAVRCDSRGARLDEGRWLTTLEALPDDPKPNVYKDCWADADLTIAGNGTKLLFLRIRLHAQGDFRIGAMLFGDAPRQRAVGRLEVRESTTMTIGGTIGELLLEGEELIGSTVDMHPSHAQVWRDKLAEVIPSLTDEDRDWWTEAVSGAPTKWLDPEHARVAVASRVELLYELRRRLSNPEDSLARSFRGGLHKHT